MRAKAAESVMRVLASDLGHPQGPIWLDDGSLLVTEFRSRTLTRVWGEGRTEAIARFEGGPMNAALGTDGHVYVANSGGLTFDQLCYAQTDKLPVEIAATGWVDRVDMATGRVERLYDGVGEQPLLAPYQLVFDGTGHFYLADSGRVSRRTISRGRLLHAAMDGSSITEVVAPFLKLGGVALAPDREALYVSEPESGRLYRWKITAPGKLEKIEDHARSPGHGGDLIYAPTRYARAASIAAEASGRVCIATLDAGGITSVDPVTRDWDFTPVEFDTHVSSLCFGGADMSKLYATCTAKGLLVEIDWPRPGLRLNQH